MITLAQLIVDRAAAALPIRAEFDSLPAFQLSMRFSDLAPLCPSRIEPSLEKRRASALNVEIGTPLPRCGLLSPDGRGAAWVLSGGSPLAYGACGCAVCPRIAGGGR